MNKRLETIQQELDTMLEATRNANSTGRCAICLNPMAGKASKEFPGLCTPCELNIKEPPTCLP